MHTGQRRISRIRRSLLTLIALGLFVGALAPAAHAEPSPVRSGTILFGVPVLGPQICALSPDCAAWRKAHCPSRLVSGPVAVSTSIVDVRDLTGSERRLHMWGPVVSWLGSTNVEFWSGSCRRVGKVFVEHGNGWFVVPGDARFMTIPSSIGPIQCDLS